MIPTKSPILEYEKKTEDQIIDEDDRISVMDGTEQFATFAKNHIQKIRVERRSSFKHPVIGGLVGLIFISLPLQTYLGDPLKLWWLLLASPMRLVGGAFMLFFGSLLIWQLVRRQHETWVIFELVQGEREFCLGGELSSNEQRVVDMMNDR